jgi:serine/threonine protein kinase
LLRWARDAACGIYHLHSLEPPICHRDIATRNLLLHEDRVKVADFGMARKQRQEEVVYDRRLLGPIKWMAPEALNMMEKKQKSTMPESDVFMFGITLWEMLAREYPHMTMDHNYVWTQVSVRLDWAYTVQSDQI